MSRKLTYQLVFVLSFLTGCSDQQTTFGSEEELMAYVNDSGNGFIQSTESDAFVLEAQLVPAIADDKEPQLTVRIRLNRQDGGSVLDFGQVGQQEALARESYLAFEMTGDVYLQDGEQIISPVFYHYERNYGLKPSVDLFFKFKAFQPSGDVKLVYRDQLFGQGLLTIHFNQALFSNCHVQN